MKVTEKDVAYVAELANLELTEEERSRNVARPEFHSRIRRPAQ